MNLPRIILATLGFAVLAAGTGAQPVGPVPAGTRVLRDLAYVTNGHERQKLDLYLPERTGDPTPLLVWIHGGGWAGGDKKGGGPPLNAGYTQRGYAVASLNYRRSGEAIFPAPIEDCKAALRWLRAHAKEYNLDPAHIGVWGASSGGHFVALLGATGATREFDVGENLDQSSAVQAVCDYFGPVDLVLLGGPVPADITQVKPTERALESRFVGGPVLQEPFRTLAGRASPLTYLAQGAPPYLIVHGDHDPMVPHRQSELLFAALKAAGVPVHFHTIKGAGHGVGFGGQEVAAMIAAFFDLHLMGQKTAAAWPVAMTSDSVASTSGANRPEQTGPDKPPGGSRLNSKVEDIGSGGMAVTWEYLTKYDDADKDGKVTRGEFKGLQKAFDRIDRNGDGVITKEEFEQGFPPR